MRAMRIQHGLPLGLLFVVVFLTLWLHAIAPGLLAIAAVLWLLLGIALRVRAWRIVDTPVSKVSAAAVGASEFSGVVHGNEPQPAPGSGIPCVWYRWQLQEYRHSGKQSSWHVEQQRDFNEGFWLADDTGRIWIATANAIFDGIDSHRMPVPDRSGRWRQVEWRIAEGQQISVVGPVCAAGNDLVVSCDKGDGRDFIISDDSKHVVARRYSTAAWISLALGLIAIVLVPLLRFNDTVGANGKDETHISLAGNGRLALILGAIYVGALAFSWFGRIYNRLVVVRVQAEKAWSSIEVQLQRRHDLIDNLVTVVKKYASYEADALTSITATRGLPNDEQVRAATVQDAAERDRATQLVALAESTPALKADAEFATLAATLTDTENRIAYSRQFYNDAVTVLRDRRGTFPYILISWLTPVPSFELFGNVPKPTNSMAV
jgi:LemA protein